jgi:hypothetical protein
MNNGLMFNKDEQDKKLNDPYPGDVAPVQPVGPYPGDAVQAPKADPYPGDAALARRADPYPGDAAQIPRADPYPGDKPVPKADPYPGDAALSRPAGTEIPADYRPPSDFEMAGRRREMDVDRLEGGDAVDRMMRENLNRYIDQSRGRMDAAGNPMLDPARISALESAMSSTNRLQYITTGIPEGALMATALGATDTRGKDGDPYKVAPMIQAAPKLSLTDWLEQRKTGQDFAAKEGDEKWKNEVERPFKRDVEQPYLQEKYARDMRPLESRELKDEAGNLIGYDVNGTFKAAPDASLVERRALLNERTQMELDRDRETIEQVRSGRVKAVPATAPDGTTVGYWVGSRLVQKNDNIFGALLASLNGDPAAGAAAAPAAQPPPAMMDAHEAAKAAGAPTFSFNGKTYKVKQ